MISLNNIISNNFLYYNFYVKVDKTNPLLDVTFDNVHILNQDIVSAKPHILIKLKDEAKFLLLNDTSMLKVQVRYPDGSLHPYYFNTDTCASPLPPVVLTILPRLTFTLRSVSNIILKETITN